MRDRLRAPEEGVNLHGRAFVDALDDTGVLGGDGSVRPEGRAGPFYIGPDFAGQFLFTGQWG